MKLLFTCDCCGHQESMETYGPRWNWYELKLQDVKGHIEISLCDNCYIFNFRPYMQPTLAILVREKLKAAYEKARNKIQRKST